MKKTDVVLNELRADHSCDRCRGAGGEQGLHASAIAEIERLRTALDSAAAKLSQLATLPITNGPKKLARSAAESAERVLNVALPHEKCYPSEPLPHLNCYRRPGV